MTQATVGGAVAEEASVQYLIEEGFGAHYIVQPGYSDPLEGPTFVEESQRRRSFKRALGEAASMGLALADPETYPETEGIDGTVRWLLLPAGRSAN